MCDWANWCSLRTRLQIYTTEYTNGTDFRPAKRLPVEHIVHFDTW
jgi:hypothetical protein